MRKVASVRGTEPVDLVDTVLAEVARRDLFTTGEAVDLLHGLQNTMRDGSTARAIARIVTEAEESYCATTLLDRSRLVDPLLDIRLAVTP